MHIFTKNRNFGDNIHHQMKSKKHIVFPRQQKLLEVMGENLKLARKRRGITSIQAAERAAIDRGTLRKIEAGDPSVSLGAYINVLRVYNLQEDISKIAADDPLGRKLQDLAILSNA